MQEIRTGKVVEIDRQLWAEVLLDVRMMLLSSDHTTVETNCSLHRTHTQ